MKEQKKLSTTGFSKASQWQKNVFSNVFILMFINCHCKNNENACGTSTCACAKNVGAKER